jgi:hypothetical protein
VAPRDAVQLAGLMNTLELTEITVRQASYQADILNSQPQT